MSGIACIFHADGRPVDPALIRRMTAEMAYRGPDGYGHWHEGAVALGHCQMHATAESLDEVQPMVSDDKTLTLVLDGYLANPSEVRAELLLRGVRLRGQSDAELVLQAYATWGEGCGRQLDGEFSAIIYDARRKALFCLRDHQGLRPLLYHWDGNTLVAASDIGAILAALPQTPALDRFYLAEIMAHVPLSADRSPYQGITRAPCASSMTVDANGLRTAPYWTLPLDVTIRYRTDGEYVEHYRSMLQDCVRRAARTHLPLAAEVSGGLDSSAVFAMADCLDRDGRLPAPSIKGYTFRAPEGTPADEIEYARAMAAFVGREVQEVPLFLPDSDWFEQQGAANRDLPPFPNMAMTLGMHRQMAADGSRAVINGQGGDQWLEGSAHAYHELLRDLDWRRLIESLRGDAAWSGWKPTAIRALRSGLSPWLPTPLKRVLRHLGRGPARRQRGWTWLAPDLCEYINDAAEERRQLVDVRWHEHYKIAKWQQPFVQRITESYSRQHAQAGLESRSPMFSRAFIEFSAQTPEYIRQRGPSHRHIHRLAMQGLVAPDVLQRSTKADFSAVYYHHLPMLDRVVGIELAQESLGLVNPDGLLQRYKEFCSATIDERPYWDIWGLYVVRSLTRRLGQERYQGN